jgi:hypothetical protein
MHIRYKSMKTLDTKMLIYHDTYAMQDAKMHKRKAIHMLHKGLPPPTQKTKHTPRSPRKRVKLA